MDRSILRRWPTILALAMVYIAVFFDWNWVWGLLFIIWTVPALFSGRAFFVESIERRRNPVLYWFIVITWIGLSLYLIAADLWPLLGVSDA